MLEAASRAATRRRWQCILPTRWVWWLQVVAVISRVPADVVAIWSQAGGLTASNNPRRGTLSCGVAGAPRGIRTPNRQIRSLVLCVDLVGSRRIWPAQVGWVVDLVGSRPVPSDRLDDQMDDQAVRRGALGHPDHGGHCGVGTRYSIW